MHAIDPVTGQQSGPDLFSYVEVLEGYLVTHPDGYKVRFGPEDKTRVAVYAAKQHAIMEEMFVKRVMK